MRSRLEELQATAAADAAPVEAQGYPRGSMIPYDQVLKELVLALGAALFLANVFALIRRRADADEAAAKTVAKSRQGSPVPGNKRTDEKHDLTQAPVARTVTYMVLGLFVAIWALASIVS